MSRFITTTVPLLFMAIAATELAWAQSITSGAVTGLVTDPSGAGVPAAETILTNAGTGVSQTATTTAQGEFRFAFVSPGSYTLRVTAAGFQTQQKSGIIVTAGQPVSADIELAVAKGSTTVEVTEQASVLQTENADIATAYTAMQVENLPNPGGDLTYIAQTAPGVAMNTQSGYGNFSANGMPATSNLFTVNGMNFNDPYLNLNNSGASNLMLGSNDIAEANVITNAYSGQYGQYAGAQISYSTKSGTNDFHGNAVYLWNGRALNANNFENNASGNPRAFDNFNQWQTGAQGHIWRDHTFFAADYEGVRVVLPTNPVPTLIPSPQFQAATLANVAQMNSAEVPFYRQMFSVFNGAPGASSARPVAENGGCGSDGATAFGLPAGTPCALQFTGSAPNKEREYLWSGRVDHTFNANDRAYIRVSRDNGFQPTYTDVFGPIFNAFSNQPQMSLQLSESHVFGPNTVNQFNGSTLFYSAAFQASNPAAAAAAIPFPVAFAGSFFGVPQNQEPQFNSVVGGEGYTFPQGRRVWQYQLIDDFSHVAGKHTIRLGFSWLHSTVVELGFGQFTTGLLTIASMQEFYNGGGPDSTFLQHFPTASEQPFYFNTFGGYVADDWKITPRLMLSLNLRLENYSNPACGHNCFSRLASTFTGNPNSGTQPYNQAILFNQKYAYPNTQTVVWEPRLGVAWNASKNTVIRTGAGIFADEIPGFLAQSAAFNAPGLFPVQVSGNALPAGTATFAPGLPGSLPVAAAQANAAFQSGFRSGATLSSLTAASPSFAPPNINNFPAMFSQPTYFKWNFEVQQSLGWHLILDLNYSGMHGEHIPLNDNSLNAYCPAVSAGGGTTCPGGFSGLPLTVPDPRFGIVNQYISGANANYNGVTASLQRRLSSALTWNLNYTWSHAQDDVSNGGLLPFNFGTNISLQNPQNPRNLHANYGSSDQDVRHYLSLSWVLNDTFRHAGFHWGPNRIFGGWMLSSNLFFRTGLPFTAVDNATSAALAGYNYGGTLFATQIAPAPTTCSRANIDVPCLSTAQFVPSGSNLSAFGNVGRNTFRGPNFFDMDLSLMKEVHLTERAVFSFGASAFNLLNHPNFDQPSGDISNPNFGLITTLVGPPTSVLGAFVGSADSPRFLELRALVRF